MRPWRPLSRELGHLGMAHQGHRFMGCDFNIDAFKRYLSNDADVESKRRKRLRANPLAPWELRFGKYRVFYELVDVATVKIVAIGYKEHNDLFIRGRRVE